MKTIIAYPAFKNRETNPYQALLYEELKKRGWKVYDLGVGLRKGIRPDIVHLHWPDGFAFHRSLFKSLFRSIFLIILVSVYRLLGAKVVWTVHNLHSHEQYHPKTERCFWNRLYRRLDGWIALSDYSAGLMQTHDEIGELPQAVIPLGVYPRLGDLVEDPAPRSDREKALLYFGNLRSYKSIPSLIAAFRETRGPDMTLTIAGKCEDSHQEAFLRTNSESDGRIRLQLEFIPDEELEKLILSSSGIIIPYSGSLNSGVIFLAMTYGKPVLAPKTPTFREVAQNTGKGFLHLFDPPLTAHHIEDFKRKLETRNEAPLTIPEDYTWPVIGEKHDTYFKDLLNN